MLALLFLLLLEEIHNEILIVTNKVVRKPLRFQVVSKVLPPERIKGIQGRKLGWRWVSVVSIGTPRPRVTRRRRYVSR